MIKKQTEIPVVNSGRRLDQVCQELFPEFSRAKLQQWIKAGQLTVNGNIHKPNAKVLGGEQLSLIAEAEEQGDWLPEEIAFETVYEDDDIIVINKPAGLVVHPAAGNQTGTLLNGLLHHCPSLIAVPRCGIVHRLDKDTTGLMVVAKTLQAQTALVAQLQSRAVSRQYVALVHGRCGRQTIDADIGRDPKNRKKMAVAAGKPAITRVLPLKSVGPCSLIRVKLETGRTHQIRVHMRHVGHPLIGDQAYGKRIPKNMGVDEAVKQAIEAFPRQALHAFALGLSHPISGEPMQWAAPMSNDILTLLSAVDPSLSLDKLQNWLDKSWEEANK